MSGSATMDIREFWDDITEGLDSATAAYDRFLQTAHEAIGLD